MSCRPRRVQCRVTKALTRGQVTLLPAALQSMAKWHWLYHFVQANWLATVVLDALNQFVVNRAF